MFDGYTGELDSLVLNYSIPMKKIHIKKTGPMQAISKKKGLSIL